MNSSEMKKFMQSLSADEALRVLNDLLDNDPNLMKKAYETAIIVAGDVDADAVMNNVFNRLDRLDLDDLRGRTGRTSHGYVDPAEAAWELFEEGLDSFINEMKKYQKRALPAAAKAHCIGIIKGLRKYEEESSTEFADWVEDAPEQYVETVVEEWKKGNPASEDIAEVMSVAYGDQT